MPFLKDSRKTLKYTSSPHLAQWLWEAKTSLAVTTYEVGKCFLIGLNAEQGFSFFERTFNRCMSLCVSDDAETIWMSTLYQLWRFQNAVQSNDHQGHDRVYVPQAAYTTGDLDIHDIQLGPDNRPVFVNTLFSCLASTNETHSFTPVWKPTFISKLAPDDRCHLNGLAMTSTGPKYVSAVSASDSAQGWRSERDKGGIVIDCESQETVATGLSMPHSPRLYRDRLWILNAGTGHFGQIDLASGRFEPLTFCPGFLRGMSFIGNYALVATSKPRDNQAFQGLKLDDELSERKMKAQCQLCIIDLTTFELVHWLRFDGLVNELYDVACLPGSRRPMMIGLKNEEIHRTLSIGDPS